MSPLVHQPLTLSSPTAVNILLGRFPPAHYRILNPPSTTLLIKKPHFTSSPPVLPTETVRPLSLSRPPWKISAFLRSRAGLLCGTVCGCLLLLLDLDPDPEGIRKEPEAYRCCRVVAQRATLPREGVRSKVRGFSITPSDWW